MKERIIFISVIVALVALLLGLTIKGCQRDTENNRALESLRLTETILTKTIDKKGQEVSEYKAFQFTMNQLKKIDDSIIQAMSRDLKYFKNLASHTSVGSTTSGAVTTPVRDTVWKHGDTTFRARKFDYSDKWLTLSGTLFPDKVNVTYSIYNNITVDYFWKKNGLFRPQTLTGIITQDNPNTKTDKVIQFTVKEPSKPVYQKWWFWTIIGTTVGATTTAIIIN